jgi:hypothetical protein
MDAMQLQLMQEMGSGQIPGIPGMQAPLTADNSGVQMLMAYSQPGSGVFSRPIADLAMPDISPMAPMQPFLKNFGMIGMLGGVAGNAYLTNAMEQNGVLPMGNAGSFLQAHRTREFQQMQQAVSSQVAGQDAEGIYRTIRGGAALAGVPMNREQREAARSLSNTFAESVGPMLATAAPGFLDAISGEKGSVQGLAAQMMHANRYRVDPLTGQMGYGTEANADLVNRTFDTMFAEDNMGRMAGIRAGEVGQIYRELTPEGLVGPRGSLKGRTLTQLNKARDAGQLDDIGVEAGVDVSGNLAALGNEELAKLRQTGPMRERLSSSDARQMTDQMQSYISTLGAIREVLGENGNPNAPIPLLINALKTMTSGQMQKFDSAQLNTMVRDMQSLSQMSGKSIDQMLTMNKHNLEEQSRLGLGSTFVPSATKVGVITGMAFQEQGGAVGWGAMSRAEAEEAAGDLFSRGVASEMGNALAAVGRIERSGDFGDNEHGKRLKAVMEAARAQESTYIDPKTGKERALPTHEAEFRALVTAGNAKEGFAVDGMNHSSFNQMLGDKASNTEFLSGDAPLQQAAFSNQARSVNRAIERDVSNRLRSQAPLEKAHKDTKTRNQAAAAMATAANAALVDVPTHKLTDPEFRNRAIADALLAEAGNHGVTLSDKEALLMAETVYGQAQESSRRETGKDYVGFAQIHGKGVSESRAKLTAQVRARSGVNEQMSRLGPTGSVPQRLITGIQKQGDRGEEADVTELLMGVFGTEMDLARENLMPELQAVADGQAKVDRLSAELDGATPERRRELEREIARSTEELSVRVDAALEISKELGIGGGAETFDREDIAKATAAERNLEHLNRNDQVRLLAASGEVTDAERAAVGDSQLSRRDLEALGVAERKAALAEADTQAAGAIEELPEEVKSLYETMKARGVSEGAARARIQQVMRDSVGTADDFSSAVADTYGNTKVKDLGEIEQKTIVRSRRSSLNMAPTDDEINDRMKELGLTRPDGTVIPTEENLKELRAELAKATPERQEALRAELKTKETARWDFRQLTEEQLLAENQLRALGQLEEGQTLNTKVTELDGMDIGLRQQLKGVANDDPARKTEIVSKYLDSKTMQQFYGTDAEVEANRDASIAQLGTAEGQQSLRDTSANIATMSDTRREFHMDKDAGTRLGAARSLRAVRRSREADDGLQELADRYYSGSVDAMVTSKGLAMSDKGKEQAELDFTKLTAEEKETVAARLSEQAGIAVSAGDLTAQHYKAYVGLQGRDYLKEMAAANQELAGATDNSLLAADLDVTQTELSALQKMATLSTTDVSAEAKKLGMTEEKYRGIMEGGAFDARLHLFEGPDQEKQLREAKSDEASLSEDQVRLDRVQANRAKGGDGAADHDEEERLITERMKRPMADRRKRMIAAKLDPDKEEDIQTYLGQLDSQVAANQLEARRDDYMTQRQVLIDQGMGEQEIDAKLGTMEAYEAEAQKSLKAERELDLSRSDLALAEGFGIDTTKEDSPELKEFQESIGGHGDSDTRTHALVAGYLTKVEGLEIGEADSTAIEKLDMLTDQYAAANPADRKKLAETHKMDVKDLDRMMRQTEFLGLYDDKDAYTKEDFRDAMGQVKGRDIATELAKEEERLLTLTGTVHLTGVVVGEGTLDNVSGRTVR